MTQSLVTLHAESGPDGLQYWLYPTSQNDRVQCKPKTTGVQWGHVCQHASAGALCIKRIDPVYLVPWILAPPSTCKSTVLTSVHEQLSLNLTHCILHNFLSTSYPVLLSKSKRVKKVLILVTCLLPVPAERNASTCRALLSSSKYRKWCKFVADIRRSTEILSVLNDDDFLSP